MSTTTTASSISRGRELLGQTVAVIGGSAGIGHNLPHEAPEAFAKAVVDVDAY